MTYAAAHDKCIADEMAGKTNVEHMGDSANEGPPGVFREQGNTGNLAMGTREHCKKIVGNKGTSNRLGNREQTQKITRPYVFYINMGVIKDFLLFSDFFGKLLFPFLAFSLHSEATVLV